MGPQCRAYAAAQGGVDFYSNPGSAEDETELPDGPGGCTYVNEGAGAYKFSMRDPEDDSVECNEVVSCVCFNKPDVVTTPSFVDGDAETRLAKWRCSPGGGVSDGFNGEVNYVEPNLE